MPFQRPAFTYVNENAVFTDSVMEATKDFAKSKPWQGDADERADKFRAYHDAMCKACGIECVLEIVGPSNSGRSGAEARMSSAGDMIVIAGKLSVVTYLYAFAKLIYGEDSDLQLTFAINLFRVGFPKSFARADLSGPMVA